MKRISIIMVFTAVLLLSGCGGVQTGQQKSGGDVATNKQPQQNIPSPANKDNNSNNTMNGNSSSQGVGDNSELVKKYQSAVLRTSLGDIKVKLDGASAPVTVGNFLKLAENGFYNGTKFHRVIKGFMIQGGDPLSKDGSKKDYWGTGGPGYKFNDELKGTETYPQGTLAMANSGPDTNGSQFFIVTASPSTPLPPKYTVFGHVTTGMDVALQIENVQTVAPGQIDRPVEDVIINSIEPSGN